jgi:gliding motility associated protien GldN
MTIFNACRLFLTAAITVTASMSFAQVGSSDPAVPATGSGVSSQWLPSRTPDGAYDRIPDKERARKPVPWQYLREDDILWKKRVWREINTLEKQNIAFRYVGDEHTGGGMFIEILIDAIKNGKIVAYSSFTDDRFTTVLTKEQLMEQTAGKTDTVWLTDPITGEEIMKLKTTDFKPEDITKYRIKEDWIFDRNVGQMIVRIVGIAPVKDIYDENGTFRGSQAMFWLYYPEIRPLLANYEVVNPSNDMFRPTWDEFFESRMFSARITKVSNPYGVINGGYGENFMEKFGNNSMEALYEGKRAAEEIFNKEHDMWVY